MEVPVVDSFRDTVVSQPFDVAARTLEQLVGMRSLLLSFVVETVARLSSCGELRDVDEKSVADWLSLRLGLSRAESSDLARVARSFPVMPRVRAAFCSGDLDLVRASLVVRLVETAADDEEMAKSAPSMSIAHLRRLVARKRVVDSDAGSRAHASRHLRFRHDEARQETRFSGSVPLDLGLLVDRACSVSADAYPTDPVTGEYPDRQAAMADALCDLVLDNTTCTTEILVDVDARPSPPSSSSTGRRAQIGDPPRESQDGSEPNGVTADVEGHAVTRSTLERLLCQGSVRRVFTGESGEPVGVGRSARLCPPWLSRLVRRRDTGCRFPGCDRVRHLHEHHVAEWDDDVGRTDLDNVVLLCSRHHRYLHELGWRLRGHPSEELVFAHPDGRTTTGREPRVEDDVVASLRGTVDGTVTALADVCADEEEVGTIDDLALRHDIDEGLVGDRLDHLLDKRAGPLVEGPSPGRLRIAEPGAWASPTSGTRAIGPTIRTGRPSRATRRSDTATTATTTTGTTTTRTDGDGGRHDGKWRSPPR